MKPLSKKTRRISQITLIVIFAILVPILILYSSGYRLDDAKSLVKTGGIYILSDISNTRVYIDDDFIEDNGKVLRNTLVQNLRPNRVYKVRVEKDGYRTWIKDLYVLPNLVTEGKILMLKNDLEFREIDITLQDDKTATSSSVVNPQYKEVLKFFEEDRNQFEVDIATTTTIVKSGKKTSSTIIISGIQIPDYLEKLEIEDLNKKKMLKERQKIVSWIENGDINVLWGGGIDSIPYYFCMEECKEEIRVNLGDDIIRYDFFPGRDDVFVVLTNQGIFAVEIDNRSAQNVQSIKSGQNLDFRVMNGRIIIKEDESFLELI